MKQTRIAITFMLVMTLVNPLFAQAAKQIQPLEDKSLTVAEYEKLGMPSVKKKWILDDYKKAADIVSQLKKTPEKLPRFQSKTSGPVFAKFIDLNRMEDIIADSSSSSAAQMLISMEMVQCLKGIGMVYTSAAWPKYSLTVEQIELEEPMLAILVKAQVGARDFFESLDQSDSKYEFRKKSYISMQQGYGTVVGGMNVILTDHVYVSPESRKRHAEIMHKYVPDILNLLTDAQRVDYRSRLDKLAVSEKDHHIKKLLDQIVERVKP